jgi:glutathione S-transferase
MRLVWIVVGLVLIEYLVFVVMAGRARGQFGVAAPAAHGHPIFERYFRVQQNTVEQLVVFLPSIYLFARYASEGGAAVLGLVFLVGRALYARGYVIDPARRGPGFLLTIAANVVLLIGGLLGVILGHR